MPRTGTRGGRRAKQALLSLFCLLAFSFFEEWNRSGNSLKKKTRAKKSLRGKNSKKAMSSPRRTSPRRGTVVNDLRARPGQADATASRRLSLSL